MISVAELKQLIYRESGYKIQVQDNDPIMAAFYVNIATLGEALKHAEGIQKATEDAISRLPGAADLEMKRAGERVLSTLSQEVSRIAQRIAGDAAAAEKARALSSATMMVVSGGAICAILFATVGYILCMSMDKLEIIDARQQIKETKEQASNAINTAMQNKVWIDTPEGKAAYHFYTTNWPQLVRCEAPFMEKVGTDGCRMVQDRSFFGENKSPIWKIVPEKK